MAQQMVNGSYYEGSVTVTNRMSKRYAVVNPPFQGKHKKPDAEIRYLRYCTRRYGEASPDNNWDEDFRESENLFQR